MAAMEHREAKKTKEILRNKCSGWHHSDAAKEKISQRSKEMWLDDELRRRMTRRGSDHWNYGKKRSPETVAKMVEGRKGYRHTEEWINWAKERFSGEGNPNYGRKFDEEFCRKQSEKMKQYMSDPLNREHLRECFDRKTVVQKKRFWRDFRCI